MNIGRLIKQRRTELGLTLEQIGEIVGVGKSTVRKWENGDIANMRRDKIALLAKALKISPVTLITGEDIDTKIDLPKNILPLKKVRYVPVIGRIACGTPVLAEENIIDRILLPDHIKADFALQTFGDSMTGAQIDDQDYVYIRSQPEVENGEIAAVLIGEEATLKKVYREDDKLTLLPANPKHDPIMFVKSELKQVRIIGKAVAVLKNLE